MQSRVFRSGTVFIASLALLAACGGGGNDTPPKKETTIEKLDCADFSTVSTPMGRLANNAWNKQAAGGFAWSQCLEKRTTEASTDYGWSWVWPAAGTSPMYSNPQIIVGAKPWDAGPGNDARFPKQISATNRLLVSFDAETQATGGLFNLATMMWLTRSATAANPADPSTIATQISVVTESNLPTIAGTKRAEILVDGTSWEVWVGENLGSSPTTTNRWTIITYRSKSTMRTASFDARKLIGDAVSRGYANASHYIADVELGNEIAGGSGSTFIKSFKVTID
jgi:hypothetical protein